MQYYRMKMLFKCCKALGNALQEITKSQIKKQLPQTQMNLKASKIKQLKYSWEQEITIRIEMNCNIQNRNESTS